MLKQKLLILMVLKILLLLQSKPIDFRYKTKSNFFKSTKTD